MKILITLGILAGSTLAGYLSEPMLRAHFTALSESAPAIEEPPASEAEVSATPASEIPPPENAEASDPLPAPETPVAEEAAVQESPEAALDPDTPMPDAASKDTAPVEPEPVPAPQTTGEPESPAVEPASESPPVITLTENEILELMKNSLGSGELKEFSLEQVDASTWQAGEEQEIDGIVYQTGTVSYTAETIFGERLIQAKALIQNGMIKRWIWPVSGVEIK